MGSIIKSKKIVEDKIVLYRNEYIRERWKPRWSRKQTQSLYAISIERAEHQGDQGNILQPKEEQEKYTKMFSFQLHLLSYCENRIAA